MNRIDALREARDVAQVALASYLKIRCAGIPVFVFEGKECPSFYVGRITASVGVCKFKQLIARKKSNVLNLRELIKRNHSTKEDVVLYFIDRDFDENSEPKEMPDVYITRGYSIENELLTWSVVEYFIRAYFDIAGAEDEAALNSLQENYEYFFSLYIEATRTLQLQFFICRCCRIPCTVDDDIFTYIAADWEARALIQKFRSDAEARSSLRIAEDKWANSDVTPHIERFMGLNPLLEWRGKWHFSFLRKFLIRASEQRRAGHAPFKRAAKVEFNPEYPGLLGALASGMPAPECLKTFVTRMLNSTGTPLPAK